MIKDKIKQDIIENIEKDEDINELLSELFKKKRAKQNIWLSGQWWWQA